MKKFLAFLAAFLSGFVLLFAISRIRRQAESSVPDHDPLDALKTSDQAYLDYKRRLMEEEGRLTALKAKEVEDAFRRAFGL